jgi:hypothetical protein
MKLLKNLTIFSCLCLSAIQAQVITTSPPQMKNIQPEENKMKNLTQVGNDYMTLMNRIGSEQNLSHSKEVMTLFAPSCKKIVNGAVWYESADNYLPQLLATGEKVGFWSIEPLDVIPGADNRTVVIRFLVHTEKAGIWNTLVILRCNEQHLITEINEVFNSYEGAQ